MAATPHEILTFTGRGASVRDYHRLKAALDRLQSTTVATSLRQAHERRMHRFSWINEWTEHADAHGNAAGIDLIVPDWFYRAVLDDARSHDLPTMKRAGLTRKNAEKRGALSKRHTRTLDPSLVQFIESLAIADARRDHLSLNDPITRHDIVDGERMRQGGASIDGARGHLRKIFD